MKRVFLIAIGVAVALSLGGRAVNAAPFAYADGGLMVTFNGTEIPDNISLIKAQFSPTNPNGALLTVTDPLLKTTLGEQGQYGFDLEVGPPPAFAMTGGLQSKDWNAPGVTTGGNIAWAWNIYGNPATAAQPGPGNPALVPINSTLRGTSVSLTEFLLTPLGGGSFQMDIAGILPTDGFIHWYTPAFGSTALAPEASAIRFYGSLTYTKSFDTSVDPIGQDWYAGRVYFEPIPEPAFFQMGALAAMGGFGLLRLRRRA